MKRYLSLFLVCMTLSLAAKAQEKVYVPYFDVLGMHPDYQVSFTRLFKSYVELEGRYSPVMGQVSRDSIYTIDELAARDQAEKAGAPYYFIGEVNRLSDVMICSFGLYETSSGKKVWNDVLKAITPDDLDPILNRVAKAMGTDEKATRAGDIYSVTNYESQELNQTYSYYLFGVTIGGAYPFYRDVENPFAAGLGAMLTYDSRNIILDLTAEGYFGDVDIYFLSINALYPLSDQNSTPFLRGGLGLAGTNVVFEDKEYELFNIYADYNSGLMLFLGGGYLINRDNDVNLRIGARTYLPFYQIEDQTAPGIMFNVTALF